jgi:hypothetical protein
MEGGFPKLIQIGAATEIAPARGLQGSSRLWTVYSASLQFVTFWSTASQPKGLALDLQEPLALGDIGPIRSRISPFTRCRSR